MHSLGGRLMALRNGKPAMHVNRVRKSHQTLHMGMAEFGTRDPDPATSFASVSLPIVATISPRRLVRERIDRIVRVVIQETIVRRRCLRTNAPIVVRHAPRPG